MALVRPTPAAADRAGWLETVARAATMLARCRRLTGDRAGAEALLRRAAAVASKTGFPAAERSDRSELAGVLAEDGRTTEAARQEDRAAAVDTRMKVGIVEGRASFRSGATALGWPVHG